MLSISDLLTKLTPDQVNQTFINTLEGLNVPASKWRKGGSLRTMMLVVATVFSQWTSLVVDAISAGFIETASGGWLTLLAYYVYGITRPAATFATGQVQLTNGGGGVWSYNAGEVTVLNAVTGKAYTNSVAFTLNPGDVKLVDVQAKELGTASNANPGAVSKLETVIPYVTVTNPDSIVGQDAMTDADLRQMCLDKLGTLSNGGPRSAYAFAVRAATRPDGTAVNINRYTVSEASSTGTVTIYLASPSGVPDATDVTAVTTSVEQIARPDAVTVNVLAATAVPLTRALTIWAKTTVGVAPTDIATAAAAAIDAAISSYRIGGFKKPPSTQGYFYAEFLAGAAQSAHPTIFAVDGAGADLALNDGQVATNAVTVTVNLVSAS